MKEKKELIKIMTINKNTKVSYIISTLLNIINRWSNGNKEIEIYFYSKKKGQINKLGVSE